MKITRYAAAVAAVLALAACGQPAHTPQPGATPAAIATTAAAVDPGKEGCRANADAQAGNGAGMEDPDVMGRVADLLQRSSNERLAIEGQMLASRVELARAARGAEDELVMAAKLVTGSFQVTVACAEAGF